MKWIYRKRKLVLIIMIFFIVMLLSCGCSTKTQENNQNGNQETHGNQEPNQQEQQPKPVEKDPIEELLKSMTLEEKIGQMLISGIDGYQINENEIKLIRDYHIGGFILFGRNIVTPNQLLELTNSMKSSNASNKAPLIISVDEEGGRISRIPKAIKNLPSSKAIGNIDSKEFSYEIGMLLAEKVKTFGINMDFAPVLDINSNPQNPVIGDRAFGSEEELVTRLGVQTMKGIKAGGVIPVVKHFPGHGDTAEDSHLGLPTVNNDIDRLKSFELIPFENAIDNDADCVMVAHILLPQIDGENPATLSKTIITEMLRKKLNFEGVVITDDMTMGAISQNYDLAEAAIKAINAGNDIILVAHKYENSLFAFTTIHKAVLDGSITENRIDESVYRILKLKQKYGLQDNIIENFNIDRINKRIEYTLQKYK